MNVKRKCKVNSGLTMISFYYLFLLHQLCADWRHFSASFNAESTKDMAGGFGGKFTPGKEHSHHWTKLLWLFSLCKLCFWHLGFSMRSGNGINQNSSDEVVDGINKLGCVLVFDILLVTTMPPTSDGEALQWSFLQCLH